MASKYTVNTDPIIVVCMECGCPSKDHVFVSMLESRCPTDTRPLTDEELEHIKWEANDGYNKMKKSQALAVYSHWLDRFYGL